MFVALSLKEIRDMIFSKNQSNINPKANTQKHTHLQGTQTLTQS